MFKAVTFVDDAGRVVEAEIDGSRMAVPRGDPGLGELMQRYMMMCAQRQNDDVKKVALLGSLVFFVFIIAFAVLAPWVWAPWFIGVLSPLFILVPLAVLLQRDRKRKMAGIRDYLASYGRCGGCGYPLRELPVDENRLIVCSECRAAWRADRTRFDEPVVTQREGDSEEDITIKRVLGFRTSFPVVEDRDGRVFRTADPWLPGGRAWLGEDWKAARSRVLGRLLWMRIGHLALVLMITPGAIGMIKGGVQGVQAIARGSMPSGIQICAIVMTPIIVVGFPQIFWLVWRCRSPMIARRVAQSLLDEGLCPACSRVLPLVAGDRRVCEHCGGAWGDAMFEKPKA